MHNEFLGKQGETPTFSQDLFGQFVVPSKVQSPGNLTRTYLGCGTDREGKKFSDPRSKQTISDPQTRKLKCTVACSTREERKALTRERLRSWRNSERRLARQVISARGVLIALTRSGVKPRKEGLRGRPAIKIPSAHEDSAILWRGIFWKPFTTM